MGLIASLKSWVDNEILTAADLNANFSEVRTTVNAWAAFKDEAQTFTQPQTFSAALTATGGLAVSGGATMDTATVSSGLTVSAGGATITGTVAATSFTGIGSGLTGITVSAANVTPGTFTAGAYDVPGTLTADAVVVDNGQLRARRITQTGAGGTVNFSTANHIRHTMTGNGTLTLTGGVAGGVYTVEVLQDATGGRTVAWSGAMWAGGVAPTSTTTPSRKDVFTFFFDGAAYLGVPFGANFASTA